MFVKSFFHHYWRYLLICGCAVIFTAPSCPKSKSNPNSNGDSSTLVVTSISTSGISQTGATISWNTNRPADSKVEYGLTTSYGNVVSLATMETSHRLNLVGLTPDTLYHFRVTSKDAGGKESASSDLTFRTGGPLPGPAPVGEFDETMGPFASWTNVKMPPYGARGDGNNDDTEELQAALDALSSGGPVKTLFLPAGVYRITQTLTLRNTIYVNVIGASSDTTILQWGGAPGGTMMHIDGVAYSRFNSLTWDGQTRASVAVSQSKRDNGLQHFDTGNAFVADVFKDVEYGILAGANDIGAAETSVVRCRFIRNSQAGINTRNFNALDWWVWFCYFEDCAIGVTNNQGAGNFNVYNSVFKRSSVADILIEHVMLYSIRNNYSIGSKVFYNSLGVGQNGAMTVIQGNMVLDTGDPTAIKIGDFGPVIMLDNTFRSKEGAPGPAIKLDVADTLAFGNTFTVSNQIVAPGRHIFDSNRTVSRGEIAPSEPVIPFNYVSKNRQVFDVPPGADATAIQARINSAGAHCGQRPIVHLPAADYMINSSLIVPANCDIQIVGDGGHSVLNWTGSGSGPLITLQGPSKAILRDFRVQGASEADGIVIANADQERGRVYMQEAFANVSTQNGLLVQELDNASVELRGFQHQQSLGSSVKVIGGPGAASGQILGGRTIMIAVASSNNKLSYEVTQGGRLVVKDSWYETGANNPGFIKLTGNGFVTFEQGRVFTQPQNTTPPAIDIQNYTGKATISALHLEDGIVTSEGGTGPVLALGLMGLRANYFVNNTAARAALVNSRWYDKTFGTRPVNNIGNFDTAFLVDMLTQTRGANLSNEYLAIPPEVTDVRMYRMIAEKTRIGFHIKR